MLSNWSTKAARGEHICGTTARICQKSRRLASGDEDLVGYFRPALSSHVESARQPVRIGSEVFGDGEAGGGI